MTNPSSRRTRSTSESGDRRGLRSGLTAALFVLVLSGHVGTQDAFFVGPAGPYRVQVSIRPPGVVPGLAQLSVRIDGLAEITSVSTQAAQWNVGSRGAPSPDQARRVPGDSALWSSQLWLMTRGSYAINIVVEGSLGPGSVMVPLSSVATQKLGMTRGVGWLLAALGLFLTLGLVSLIGAAARESVLDAGEAPSAARRRRARMAMAIGAAVLVAALTGGRAWWNAVDAAYARRLFRPTPSSVGVAADSFGAPRIVRLAISDSAFFAGQLSPMIPDHGKLVHLFLIREGSAELAHLHPEPRDSTTFDAMAGPLAGGRYRYFADVVHESGFAQTLTGTTDVPAPSAADAAFSEADDAAFAGAREDGARHNLPSGVTVDFDRAQDIAAASDLLLRFTVREVDGSVATLVPYMGMPGHAMVASDAGDVFAHLHSNGSFAMASLAALSAIERGDTLASRRPGAPRPRIDAAGAGPHEPHLTSEGQLEFPFAFPKAGSYTVWVQFRRGGPVETAAFRVEVRTQQTLSARR